MMYSGCDGSGENENTNINYNSQGEELLLFEDDFESDDGNWGLSTNSIGMSSSSAELLDGELKLYASGTELGNASATANLEARIDITQFTTLSIDIDINLIESPSGWGGISLSIFKRRVGIAHLSGEINVDLSYINSNLTVVVNGSNCQDNDNCSIEEGGTTDQFLNLYFKVNASDPFRFPSADMSVSGISISTHDYDPNYENPNDKDYDGYSEYTGDCNDEDSTIYLGAMEICDDEKDNDCDGTIDKGDQDCTTIETISLNQTGLDIAVHPLGEYVYIKQSPYQLSIVDLEDYTVVETIQEIYGGSYIKDFFVDHSGTHLYILGIGDYSITLVDLSVNKLDYISSDDWRPQSIVLSPDGNILYVGTTYFEFVTINTETFQVSDNINIDFNPLSLFITPSGDYIYCTFNHNEKIRIIETNNFNTINTIDLDAGVNEIQFSQDGDFLYFHNDEKRILKMETSNHSIIYSTDAIQNLIDWVLNPSGDYIYMTENNKDFITVLQTSDLTIVEEIAVISPSKLVVSPDNSFVYGLGDNGKNLFIIKSFTTP